jgi:hypothetical protein
LAIIYEHYVIAGIALLLILAAGILFKMVMSPELQYHSFAYRVKAKLVFWLGDIRRLDSFPWVTWASHGNYGVDLSDVREAARMCRPGDVGLHRDSWFLSNVGIPGAFKHAWIVVEDDMCVEAISEGVVKRDLMYPLLTDYAVVLRPYKMQPNKVRQAVERANGIVGCEYDANFNFDLETENEQCDDGCESHEHDGHEDYCSNLKCGAFHGAFSCTETVGYAYFPFRKELGLFRTVHAGREAIVADDYLKMRFEIVWVSPSVTLEWAKSAGLHEEGRVMIEDFIYRKTHRA